MLNYISTTLIFWGIWLLVPMLVDGLTTIINLVSVLLARHRKRKRQQLNYAPFVSIVVPVYNSADTLEACLRSIAAQDYPHQRMEVLLVNNGSTDASEMVFKRLQGELDLRLNWHSIINQGKSWALNAGIHLSHGSFIFNVDSDAVLSPNAVRAVVERMVAEPDLGAVTSSIQVLPAPANASLLQRILANCEFFEYLTAFHVGREYQTQMRNLYTLSGAFSVFRRSVLVQTFLYTQATVTEDTDITFHLYDRFRDQRIACVSDALAYVHSIPSLGALYAQRVRWQRGQVEVSARYQHLIRRPMWQPYGFVPARVLLIDHTLAFLRTVWTILLPILSSFGYPLAMVVSAVLLLYLFYLLIDIAWMFVAYLAVDKSTRRRMWRDCWILPLLPLYRMFVFWFRLSGFLHAVAEPSVWRVPDPITQIRAGLHDLRRRLSSGR
jgi:putative glycosyltransferase (exosortase G-associated)